MTTIMSVNLVCPCCGGKVPSKTWASTNTCGPCTTDLHRLAAGADPLPLEIHTCQMCGFSGGRGDFTAKTLDPELKQWIRLNLAPLVAAERPSAGRRYELAARIAEQAGEPLPHVADLYLRAAWCASGDGEEEQGRRFRREAATRFEAAIEQGKISDKQRPVLTYLVGELYRRAGEKAKSEYWFDRVKAAAGEDADAQTFVRLAKRQREDPKEFIEAES